MNIILKFICRASSDCRFYGEAAFGDAWIPFKISWIAVFGIFSIFLIYVNVKLIKANNWKINTGMRHITLLMMNVAMICESIKIKFISTIFLLVRTLYYGIDPFSLRNILDNVQNHLLFSLFFPVSMAAYILMLFQWYLRFILIYVQI